MAKRGVFQALGNLWRWTVWGLAAVLVLALWLGWSNRDSGPEGDVVAGVETPGGDEPAAEAPVTVDETVEATAEETATEEVAAEETDAPSQEAVENTLAEVQSALEGAVGTASEAANEAEGRLSDLADEAENALDDAREALERGPDEAELAQAEGVIGDEEADLNILPPELANISVPGDDATYALISVFQRDDGTIEVVSDRTENGETVQTIRLVTCAPLAVGVISEGGSPRNEAPELERIPLGSAAATIAALACGAMN